MQQWVEVVERKRSIKQFIEQAFNEEDFYQVVLCEEFIEEIAGNNLEEGNEMEGGKENGGHEIEDKKLSELENVLLGVEVNDLDNEQDYVLGGGRFALEEEMVVADYKELCNKDGEVVEVVIWL